MGNPQAAVRRAFAERFGRPPEGVWAARDLYGGADDAARLAAIAQRAENDVVGVPCGIMDQMAALACRAAHVLLLDCRSLEADQVPFAPADAGLDAAVEAALAAGALGARMTGAGFGGCRRRQEDRVTPS